MKKLAYFLSICTMLLLMAAVPVSRNMQANMAILHTAGDTSVPLLPAVPYPYNDFFMTTSPNFLFEDSLFAVEYNPTGDTLTNEGATLGRVLFYDPILSANMTISCGSCHLPEAGFSDPAQFSEGFAGGHTERNSMGLVNARFQPTGSFLWDTRTDTLREQIRIALESEVEMGMNLDTLIARVQNKPYYTNLFTSAFGSPQVTLFNIESAIGQFVRSMVSSQSKYDRGLITVWDRNIPFTNFTTQENLGKSIFFDANVGCASCHATHNFHLDAPLNNGLDMVYEDKGLGDFTLNPSDNGKFKPSSLRNIALTAPYMHDGRFETLEEVINHYSDSIQTHPNLDQRLRQSPGGAAKRLNLTQQEKDALVAFLHTLTDNAFITDPRWENPFGLDSVRTLPPPFMNTLSTDKPDPALAVKAFPNPFTDQLQVEWENLSRQSYEVRLFTLMGTLVFQSTTQENHLTIQRNNLTAGTYILTVKSAGDKIKFKEKIQIK